MSNEMEDMQLDSKIALLEFQINKMKKQEKYDSKELANYEKILKNLRDERNKPKLARMLSNAEMHHVSGRVWSMNDGCFLWMIILWAIGFLLALPFILSH